MIKNCILLHYNGRLNIKDKSVTGFGMKSRVEREREWGRERCPALREQHLVWREDTLEWGIKFNTW